MFTFCEKRDSFDTQSPIHKAVSRKITRGFNHQQTLCLNFKDACSQYFGVSPSPYKRQTLYSIYEVYLRARVNWVIYKNYL